MTIAILAALLGLVIATAAIGIPRIVARGNHPEDHADSQAYLKAIGRSAEDIARSNAGRASQQENGAGSGQARGSDDRPAPQRRTLARQFPALRMGHTTRSADRPAPHGAARQDDRRRDQLAR
jgi:hypothetical protein